jgi:quercetin dioxygenase-like cupin family protein
MQRLSLEAAARELLARVLHGRVLLEARDRPWEGRSGDLLIVPDAPHSLQALQDSAVVLTVGKP